MGNTTFEQTEIGIFMDEVYEAIDEATENLRKEVRYCASRTDTNVEGIVTFDKLFLTCSQCVMQWTYFTGNTWGQCNNGTEGMGCGDQEMFRNCADVQINSIVGAYPPGALSLYSQDS